MLVEINKKTTTKKGWRIMKKTILSFILAVVCVLLFMACGGGEPTPVLVDDCKIDTDGDGIPDCNDLCPTESGKIAPGDCGCEKSDIDSDNNGISDCVDEFDDDSLSEEAIELLSNLMIENQTGGRKYYKFQGMKGMYYDIDAYFTVYGCDLCETREITIYNSLGKRLVFKSGFPGSHLKIDNWLCQTDEEYIVMIESLLNDSYKVRLKQSDTWVGETEKEYGITDNGDYDHFEYDNQQVDAKSIILGEVQNRTSHNVEYDRDWVLFLAEEEKTYEIRVENLLDSDMAMSVYEKGSQPLYVPYASPSFRWTATVSGYAYLLLVSRNVGVHGEYSLQIVEVP